MKTILLTLFFSITLALPTHAMYDAPAPKHSSRKWHKQQRKAARKARRQQRRIRRIKWLMRSRLGKWLMKRAVRKAQRRASKRGIQPKKGKWSWADFWEILAGVILIAMIIAAPIVWLTLPGTVISVVGAVITILLLVAIAFSIPFIIMLAKILG